MVRVPKEARELTLLVEDPDAGNFVHFATDELLGLDDDADIDDVHAALDEHALARGALTGRFGR